MKLIIAVIAVTGASGAASAEKYYMRAALPSAAFVAQVDDHVYRWSQSKPDPANSKLCMAGVKTTRYVTECYDQTAGVVVADAKCSSPAPAPKAEAFLCTLSCSELKPLKMPPQPGKFIGTATSSIAAQTLCNKEPAQNGICYRDTTTNNVTFGYSDPLTIMASSKSTDTAVYCGASAGFTQVPVN